MSAGGEGCKSPRSPRTSRTRVAPWGPSSCGPAVPVASSTRSSRSGRCRRWRRLCPSIRGVRLGAAGVQRATRCIALLDRRGRRFRVRDDGAGFGTTAPAGHLERVDDDLRGDPVRDRPPHDPPRVGVDDGCAVNPAVFRPVLGDVAEPEPVRRVRSELSLHEILMRRSVRLPASPFATVGHAGEAVEAHQPGDALLPKADAEPESQFCQHPWGAVGLSRVGADATDRSRQLLVRDRSRRWRSARPVVVARSGDVQEPAGHRDRGPPAASSWTSRNTILGARSPWRRTPTRA